MKMINPIKYVFVFGAALCAAIGIIAMIIGGGIWDWIAWLIWIPAFMLLLYVIEDYGIGVAVTLLTGSSAIFVALYVWFFGAAWGEVLNGTQLMALAVASAGLVGLSLTKRSI